MFISVQNSTNTLSIKKSPFPVRAKRISKLELQSSYFDTEIIIIIIIIINNNNNADDYLDTSDSIETNSIV